MKKIFLLILIICFRIIAFSQSNFTDSLKLALKNANNDLTRCEILHLLIENESDDTVWPSYNTEMLKIAEKTLKTLGSSDTLKKIYTEYLAAAYNNIGYLHANNGDLNKGVAAYYKCIQVQNTVQDFTGISVSFTCIGNLYKNKGEYTEAIKYFKKALDISNVIHDKQGVANALFFIGDIYDYQGNISESLEHYLKSLKIREEISDKAGTASCFNNIALIYEKQDEYDKALGYHEKSLELNKSINDKFAIATSLNNIGLCYFKKGDLKKAEEYYNKSLSVYNEINDDRSTTFVYVNLGTIFQKQKDWDKALLYFNKSLKIRQELGERGGVAQCLINIANVFFHQGKIKEAEENASRALKLSQEIGYPDKIQSAANTLFQIYEIQNKGNEALKMHKLYILMRDSVKSINSQKALITQNLKYEYDKKATADSVRVTEEKKVINAQLKQEKTQRFALYGGLVLVALFGGVMFNRFKVTQKQKHIIEKQKEIVDEKQLEILDSIHYAKRIQNALMANADFINKHLLNNFILFQPKDIVSGDFYWAAEHNNKFYLAVCDSTGHGVPGAFMSLLNMGFLSEAIKEKNIEKPNEIFNYVRQRLIASMSDDGQKDGMDGILICYDKKNNILEYSAANNEPILIRNNEVIELAKDRMPIGKGESDAPFTLHTIELKPGDSLYLYTDGYADQFGGPKGKKFKYKQLNDLLLSLKDNSSLEQMQKLSNVFTDWKGDKEQVDDVLLIGIKI